MDTTKRPSVVTIAATLLIVLAVFVAGLGIANQYGLLRVGGFNRRGFIAGQGGNRSFAPQSGFSNNGTNNNQNGTGFGTGNGTGTGTGTIPTFTNRTGATGLARLTRLLRSVTLGIDIGVLLLAIVAAIGLFRGKRWGAILAIVLAAILILLAIPGMLRIFSAVVLVENLVRILLAVAVIVLLLLPISRKSFAKVDDLDLDLDTDI